ncbi:MAG: hypothetical protein ACM3N9_08040 [Syntrophothermus sp.]
MKKLLFSNFILIILLALVSSCHCGHEGTTAGTAGKRSGNEPFAHDTINKKVEIRNQGPNQHQTDSIKDAKTRGKKLASTGSAS